MAIVLGLDDLVPEDRLLQRCQEGVGAFFSTTLASFIEPIGADQRVAPRARCRAVGDL